MAYGGIDFVNERNLQDRISIMGFDGFEMSLQMNMTTIVQPMEQMGETGALLLIEKMENRLEGRMRIVLETWLEKGKTCKKVTG
jgi:DNA-binding LacI/PurR family transcriptional regulator